MSTSIPVEESYLRREEAALLRLGYSIHVVLALTAAALALTVTLMAEAISAVTPGERSHGETGKPRHGGSFM